MKDLNLLKALSDINDEFILEASGCQEEKKKRKKKPVAILALAAVLLLTLTIGVFAEETPGNNLLSKLKEVSWNRAEQSTTVDDFTVSNNASGDLKIEESYYDGEALVLGVSVDLEKDNKEIDQLIASFHVKYFEDGKEVKTTKTYNDLDIGMYPDGNGKYIGSVLVYPDTDEEELGLPDDFTVELSARYIYGSSYKDIDKRIKLDQEFAPASCEIGIDDSQVHRYEIGETVNNCVLHSVTVTPAWTDVNVELLDGGSEYAIVQVFGSDGEELEYLELYGSGHRNSSVSRILRTPDKDETELTVVVFTNKEQYSNGQALAEFTVPIDGGHNMSAYEDLPEISDDASDEVVEEQENTDETDVCTGRILVGSTLSADGGLGFFPYGTESGLMTVSFTNIRYYDSPADAGISEDELSPLYNSADMDHCTFVLMDLRLENVDAISETVVDGKNIFPIETFANAAISVDPYYGHDDETAYLAYFSDHGEDYSMFSLDQMTVKNVQVGYMLDTEQLNAGNAWVYNTEKELARCFDEEGNEFITNAASYRKIPPME